MKGAVKAPRAIASAPRPLRASGGSREHACASLRSESAHAATPRADGLKPRSPNSQTLVKAPRSVDNLTRREDHRGLGGPRVAASGIAGGGKHVGSPRISWGGADSVAPRGHGRGLADRACRVGDHGAG